MDRSIHEVVVFRLKEGVTREAFLDAVRPTQEWLARQPGMQSRTLLEPTDDRGVWVDTAVWDSLEEAQSAMERFAVEMADCEFEQLLDQESVQMLHLAVVEQAEMAAAG
jgi:hypothetical protein